MLALFACSLSLTVVVDSGAFRRLTHAQLFILAEVLVFQLVRVVSTIGELWRLIRAHLRRILVKKAEISVADSSIGGVYEVSLPADGPRNVKTIAV